MSVFTYPHPWPRVLDPFSAHLRLATSNPTQSFSLVSRSHHHFTAPPPQTALVPASRMTPFPILTRTPADPLPPDQTQTPLPDRFPYLPPESSSWDAYPPPARWPVPSSNWPSRTTSAPPE